MNKLTSLTLAALLLAPGVCCSQAATAALPLKPPLAGLVAMGDISFHRQDDDAARPSLDDLRRVPGIFDGIVINITWHQVEPTRGVLDTSEIDRVLDEIRAYNQAYAAISDASVLTGQRLLEKVEKQPDVALLRCTLCDEALVVVACGPGKQWRVALLPLEGEDLWQQMGKFRELLWERKPEANTEAMRL